MLNRYCRKVKKKTECVLKKMFGLESLKDAFSELKTLEFKLEHMTGKEIKSIDMLDVRNHAFGCYFLAKYITLKKIIDVYLDSTELEFHADDLEEFDNYGRKKI